MKADADDIIPALVDSQLSSKAMRKNWARLIQSNQVDPLLCSLCFGSMMIIAFIEDQLLIKKILSHLGLWLELKIPCSKLQG